ncbi:MAG TPA: peptidylprolyl isomerase [Oscillospiraceae bacterium]|nr:peptidylprolyl isomerase [Oscillospiraceae bacterium]HRW56817.1 peptidylprolyl isomerase [Oscillospiraceae bacterium]
MKKLTAILLAALMLCMLFSGCQLSRQLGEESEAESGEEETIDPAVYDDVCATVGGQDFTVADVDFIYAQCFQRVYSSLYSSYGDSISYILDLTKPLDEQTYSGDLTWDDYLTEYTLYSLKSIMSLINDAAAQNYVYSDAMAENVATQKTSLANAAVQSGMTEDEYLAKYYGPGATMEVFERMSTLIVEAAEYSSYREGTFGLTDEEIHAAYEADKNVYDTVSFRFAFFSGEPVEEESEATSEAVSEVTSEATSEAVSEAASEAVSEETVDPALMAEAEEKANALASTAKTEEDFVAAIVANASEEDKEYYESDEASLIEDLAYDDIPDTFSGWLFADHVYGDTTVIESDTGYYVFLFLSRNTPDYTTVNVRHILFKPETDESGVASDQNWADAEAKAEAALTEFESGEQTEEAFAAIATAQSEDDGSKENGGLYENVYKGQMVTAFEDWCYDEAREPGNTDIVKSSYGYHVMYFVGEGENYLTAYLGDQMAEDRYNDWMSGLVDAVESTTNDNLSYIGNIL